MVWLFLVGSGGGQIKVGHKNRMQIRQVQWVKAKIEMVCMAPYVYV